MWLLALQISVHRAAVIPSPKKWDEARLNSELAPDSCAEWLLQTKRWASYIFLWKVVAEPWKMPGFLASRGDEINLGPEMRLDRSELLCNKVLLKYKKDKESFWHRHQKGAEPRNWLSHLARVHITYCYITWCFYLGAFRSSWSYKAISFIFLCGLPSFPCPEREEGILDLGWLWPLVRLCLGWQRWSQDHQQLWVETEPKLWEKGLRRRI